MFDLDDYTIENFCEFYSYFGQEMWNKYKAVPNRHFYKDTKGIYFWTGDEDLSKIYINLLLSIVTSNENFAKELKNLGLRVNLKVTSLVEI